MNTFRLSSRARPRHNHAVKVCSNRESVRLRTQANITGHWYSQRRHNHAYSTMYTPLLRWQRMMSCNKHVRDAIGTLYAQLADKGIIISDRRWEQSLDLL